MSLYEDPITDGLSYIWRNLIVTQTMVCNDVEARTTSDLYDALNPFRKEDQEVVLWADQLCINESDVQERSQQVRIMGYVYKYSQICLAFLGREIEGDALTMEFMNDIGKRWGYDQHEATYYPKDPASVDTLDKEVR